MPRRWDIGARSWAIHGEVAVNRECMTSWCHGLTMLDLRRIDLKKRRHVAVPQRRLRHRPELIPLAREMFGAVIHQARRDMGWSQAALGARCGLHQSTISRLETGKLEGLAYHRLIVLLYVLREPLGIPWLLKRAGRPIDAATRIAASTPEQAEPRG